MDWLSQILFAFTNYTPRGASDDKDGPAMYVGLFVVLIFMIGCGFLIGGLWSWRVSHFPHAVGTITALWEETVRDDGTVHVYAVGKVAFTRTHNGKSFDCEITKRIGEPRDHFAVGDKLDLVPATGTCERVDIIDRMRN
ncbi:hypothetical protein LJR251_001294 [Rhizobium rhizogenes]|uniref:hypothetical protein n=1 Tax=Rhizobium rhizogenes TaxID=359 RepID=UPI001F1646A5|nr:hypothetical protein [Rhizobium rhizogenes]